MHGDDVLVAVEEALYSRFGWEPLAAALAEAAAGDGAACASWPGGDAGELASAYPAYMMNEGRYPRRFEPFLRANEHAFALSPHFWWVRGYEWAGVSLYPLRPRGVYRGPFSHSPGARPALVIGGTHDPAAPYIWAKRLTADLGNARLLTYRSDGHGAITDLNPCIVGSVLAYLEADVVPPEGASCTQEVPGAPRSASPATTAARGVEAADPLLSRATAGPAACRRGPLPDQTGEEGRARPSARSPKPGAMIAPGWAISSSATTASVVSSSAATEAAFSSVSRVTRTGSITPLVEQVAELAGQRVQAAGPRASPAPGRSPRRRRSPRWWRSSTAARTAPAARGRRRSRSRPRARGRRARASARSSAVPPPGTIPSATAARVAASAPSVRWRFSLSTTSVGAPTWITASFEDSLASRSRATSRSFSCGARSASLRICDSRAATASGGAARPR